MYFFTLGGIALFVAIFIIELLTGQPHSPLLLKIALVSTGVGVLLRFAGNSKSNKK